MRRQAMDAGKVERERGAGMSERIKVDAGLMREHKAHDIVIQDEPERRWPGVLRLVLLVGVAAWIFGALCVVAFVAFVACK